MIMGTGFPPFRGGLLRYADALGAPYILARLDELSSSVGPRFRPERAAEAAGRAATGSSIRRTRVRKRLRAWVHLAECGRTPTTSDDFQTARADHARQRTIVIVVALVCAATRFLALARSVWDWDEALFTLAHARLRRHASPSASARLPGVHRAWRSIARLVVADDFRALQAVNLIAGDAGLSGGLSLRARAAACASRPRVMAGALFAFFPNVWFFGGGAFSDIPSIVLVLFAVTFLLRGARERNAYWLGTLLLALAIGIRPQNLLIGLIPGIYATRKRRPLEILVALLIGVVVVGAAFGGAIYATGYVRRLHAHRAGARRLHLARRFVAQCRASAAVAHLRPLLHQAIPVAAR